MREDHLEYIEKLSALVEFANGIGFGPGESVSAASSLLILACKAYDLSLEEFLAILDENYESYEERIVIK